MTPEQRPFSLLALAFLGSGTNAPLDPLAVEDALSELEEALPKMTGAEEDRALADLSQFELRLSSDLTFLTRTNGPFLRDRTAHLRSRLVSRSRSRYMVDRARIREGRLRGSELLAWLGARSPEHRDLAIEHLLGIAHIPTANAPLDIDRIGYVPSGIAPIVQCIASIPITRDDVFIDLGAGVGKAVMAVHLLSGARTHGIEVQAELVKHARAVATDLQLDGAVSFVVADAQEADLADATVIYLYLPFTGPVLANVMQRIREETRRRALVICTLGLDLRGYDWLLERKTNCCWLSIYDTHVPGAAPARPKAESPFARLSESVANGR